MRPAVVTWLSCLPPLISVARAQQQTTTSTAECDTPDTPRGLGAHEDGSLYILDVGVGLQEYNRFDAGYVGLLTDTTSAQGGVEVVGDTIFVSAASSSGGTVKKFDLTGSLLQTFPSSSGTDEAPPGGYDVAVAEDGTVYVSNYLSDGVEVYDGTTGEHLRQVLEDTRALGIAFGPDGMLYAAINADNEVRRFQMSTDGQNFTLVDAFINGGSGSRVRTGPWGITVNQDDYLIYVCWAGSKELTEYSQSGAELRWWFPGQETDGVVAGGDDDGAGTGNAGTPLSPWYVTVDNAGDVYVTAQNEDVAGAGVFKYDGATGDKVDFLPVCGEGVYHALFAAIVRNTLMLLLHECTVLSSA